MNYDNELDQIIPVTVRDGGIITVNARHLHAGLGVGKDFATWIKDRIEQYDFEEGSDFSVERVLSSPDLGSAKARPQQRLEYHISVDMAKELVCVERSPQGKAYRRYLIRMEKLFRESTTALPEPEAPTTAIPTTELPPVLQIHRDQLAYLMAQGVPPATACRSADQFIRNYKPPVIEPDLEPTAKEIDSQRLLDLMQPGIWYGTEDLAILLPAKNHLREGSIQSRRSRIGKLLQHSADQLRLEKHPNPRQALYRLPAVVEFPIASCTES